MAEIKAVDNCFISMIAKIHIFAYLHIANLHKYFILRYILYPMQSSSRNWQNRKLFIHVYTYL